MLGERAEGSGRGLATHSSSMQARSVGKGGPVRKIVRGGPKLYYRVLCYVIIGGP